MTEAVSLSDGSQIWIRAIEPADKELMRTGFDRLSGDSRYFRFFTPVSRLTEKQLAYFTEVDHRDHEALVAVGPADEPVGVARFIRDPDRPDTAEVAVTVVDAWQRRGVATELLLRLVERARAEGIKRFAATCLVMNHDVIDLLQHLGVTRTSLPEAGVVRLEVELPEQEIRGHPIHHALRTAATEEVAFRHPFAGPAA